MSIKLLSEDALRKFVKASRPTTSENRVSGFATTYGNADLDGDVLERGSLTKAYETIPLLFNHDPDRVIGKIVLWDDRPEGLYIEAELTPGTPDYDTVSKLIASGAVTGFSIGARIVDSEDRGGTRHLTKLLVYEISATPIPANPLAQMDGAGYDPVMKALAALRHAFTKE